MKENFQEYKNIIIISGRYEGIDARVKKFQDGRKFQLDHLCSRVGKYQPCLWWCDCSTGWRSARNFDSVKNIAYLQSEVYTRPEKLNTKVRPMGYQKFFFRVIRPKSRMEKEKEIGFLFAHIIHICLDMKITLDIYYAVTSKWIVLWLTRSEKAESASRRMA